MRVHGSLVEVRGLGILLLGPSGVGKSECVLELVRRGSLFVADDVVELHRGRDGRLQGSASAVLTWHIEVRGLGILSIADLFGIGSVREMTGVAMVCRLVGPELADTLDRVGIDRPSEQFADVELPVVTLPALPAGTLATLVEVAARDQLLRLAGHNSAERFDAAQRVAQRLPSS